MRDTIWQCEQMLGGQVCNKLLFDTRGEAEEFLKQMSRSAPDLFWRMEAVAAASIWN